MWRATTTSRVAPHPWKEEEFHRFFDANLRRAHAVLQEAYLDLQHEQTMDTYCFSKIALRSMMVNRRYYAQGGILSWIPSDGVVRFRFGVCFLLFLRDHSDVTTVDGPLPRSSEASLIAAARFALNVYLFGAPVSSLRREELFQWTLPSQSHGVRLRPIGEPKNDE